MIPERWSEHCEVIGTAENMTRFRELRRFGLGASDAPRILGEVGSAMEIHVEKVMGPKSEPEDPDETDEKMLTGRLMEPVIAERLRLRRKLKTIQRCQLVLRSKRWPILTCTPDLVVLDPALGEVAAEAKNSTETEDWKHPTIPARKHWCQCQHTMAVTGDRVMLLAGLLWGYKLAVYEVARDDNWLNAVYIPFAYRFWDGVKARQPPDADDSEACRKALLRLFPDPVPGKRIKLPDLFDSPYETANTERARLEKACKQFKNQIQKLMGDAETAELADGTLWVWTKDKNGKRSLSRKPVKEAATEPQEESAA